MRDRSRRALGWALALGVLALVVRYGVLRDETIKAPENVSRVEGLFALLVGCTEYPHLEAAHDADTYHDRVLLEGSENDVDLLRDTLTRYLGVPTERVHTLAGWPEDPARRPTRANILAALDSLIGELRAGDRLLFHFSGHGSQAAARHKGSELDHLDELLLPADVRAWDLSLGEVPGSIRDDELWERLVAVRRAGATAWLSLDCCHAGGAVRGAGVRLRQLAPELLGVPDAPQTADRAAERTRAPTGSADHVVATTATQAHQLAPEFVLPTNWRALGRRTHGLYSFLVARALQRHGGGLSFDALHRELLQGYRAAGWDAAQPGMDGNGALRVVPGSDSAHLPVFVTKRKGQWICTAGSVRGFTAGTRLEVFATGGFGDPAQRLGHLEVERAGHLESVCKAPGEDAPQLDEQGATLPARIVARGVPALITPLALLDANGARLALEQAPAFVRRCWADESLATRFPLMTPQEAAWTLQADAGRLVLQSRTAGDAGPRFEIRPRELADRLCGLHAVLSLRALAVSESVPAWPKGLVVRPWISATEEGTRRPLTPGMQVSPGSWIGIDIANRMKVPVDLSVQILDADYGTTCVFPARGHVDGRLEASEKARLELGAWMVNDRTLGAESFVLMASPTGRDASILDLRTPSIASQVRERGARTGSDDVLRGRVPAGVRAEERRLHVHHVPWETAWGTLHVPPGVRAAATPVPPEAQVRAEPDEAWFLGTHVALVEGPAQSRAIATWQGEVTQIYICPEDAPPEAELVAAIRARAVAAPIVLRWSPSGRVAWYASEAGQAAQHDLRFEDLGGGPEAEIRSQRGQHGWERRQVRRPWLRIARARGLSEDAYRRAIRCLLGFVRHKEGM